MRKFATLAVLLGLLGLTACEQTPSRTYPFSGEACAPDDPVQDLPGDCAPPM